MVHRLVEKETSQIYWSFTFYKKNNIGTTWSPDKDTAPSRNDEAPSVEIIEVKVKVKVKVIVKVNVTVNVEYFTTRSALTKLTMCFGSIVRT